LLGTVLLLATALVVAVPLAMGRDRAATASAINDEALHDAADRAAHALRLGLALDDEVLVGEVARELVAADAAIDGIRVTLANGRAVEAGDLEAAATAIAAELDVEGIEPAADLLWLGDWPTLHTASGRRTLGHVMVVADDPAGAVALSTRSAVWPVEVWIALCLGLLSCLAAALYIRVRLLRLGRAAAEIASGNLEDATVLSGGDEIAWVGRSLAEIRHYVLEQVQRVHGRNATLLAHVTVQGDRLERLAHFASALVAPVADVDALDEVFAELGAQLDAPLVLLLVPDGSERGLRCAAAHGISPVAVSSISTDDAPWGQALSSDVPVMAPPLHAGHPWLVAAGRRVPLRGVTVQPIRFRARVEGLLVVARREPMGEADRDFLVDATKPLAIALANRAAYRASVDLSEALEQRNVALIEQRDQLRIVNRLRSQFTANMSHELRTPLNAIIGYGELLADGLYGPINDDQRGALDGVEQAARSLLTLVNQVLDLSSAEVGQLSVEFNRADLREVIDEALLIARPLARSRPYQLRATGDSLELITDAQRVLQIVTNLLNNAIKFTPEGNVTIALQATADGGATIVVTDTGIGIAEDQLELVFEEFRQVDQSSTRAHDGVGLGLAISRRLALALGGTLTATSDPGHGSAFRLTLPARPPLQILSPSSSGAHQLAA